MPKRKTEDELYQDWIQDYSSKLSSEQKEHFEALLTSDNSRELFKAGYRRQDYDRRVNELSAERERIEAELGDRAQRLWDWYQTEKPKNDGLLEEKTRLEKELRSARAGDIFAKDEPVSHNSDNGGTSDKEIAELKQALAELKAQTKTLDNLVPKVIADMAEVNYMSIKEKFEINPRDVVQYSLENKVDPMTAFHALTKDERDKREVKRIDEIKAEAFKEGQKAALSKLPGPDRIGKPSAPSVVETLTQKDYAPSDQRSRVEASVRDLLEMQTS